MVRNRKSGFTLIELLVVIAIIAILAAILFPVFAQAREKARATGCLSNAKQLGLGIAMYVQDHDEMVPRCQYNVDGMASLANRTWIQDVQPYVNNWPIARCPSEYMDPFGIWNGAQANIKWWYNWMRWPSYGYNWNYLNPSDCSYWGNAGGGLPTALAAVQSPAGTVAITDVKLTGQDSQGWFTSQSVDSPAAIWAPDCCTWSNGGWGIGAYGDTMNWAATPTYTGSYAVRHSGGGNVSFIDGHSKYFSPGGIAAGTNWRTGINSGDIVINDRSKYLWDLQ